MASLLYLRCRRKEQDGLMKGPLVRFFNNLPIARRITAHRFRSLLAAFMVLGIETYRSLETLTEHEEQLDRVYVAQRAAAEYMRLVVDYETGFRGYVMTRQDAYLIPIAECPSTSSLGRADTLRPRPPPSGHSMRPCRPCSAWSHD